MERDASQPQLSPYRHVPNALTASRLVVGLAFPFLPPAAWLPAIGYATVTEYLDGAISRRCGFESRLGSLLDPIADKIFVAAVLATLLNIGRLAWWEAALVAFRDVTVTVAAAWYLLRRRADTVADMRPTMAGKVTTTLQLLLVLALFQDVRWPPLVYATAAVSLYAAWDYVFGFRVRRAALAASPTKLPARSDDSRSRRGPTDPP